MVVITDVGGDVGGDGGGISSEAVAPFTFLLSEPTLYAFAPDVVEDAQRNTYQADESGVVYSLVVSGEALKNARKNPGLIATVAGQYASAWNQNWAVPGVVDVAETQDVTALGSLHDVFQVAVESTSGRSTSILTVADQDVRPDVFAGLVADEVKALDAQEKAG